MSDPRFARLKSDPRFRRPKKHTSKVVVDKRFQSVFEKSKTKEKKTDKYGRALSSNHESDNLRRFYKMEDEKDNDEPAPVIDFARGGVLMESSDEDEDENSDEGGTIIFNPSSSKSRADTYDEEDEEIDLDENNLADLDAQAAAYNKVLEAADEEATPVVKTKRIAVVNLDWDHVRATHLFKVFSSLVDPSAPTANPSSSIHNARSSRNPKNAKTTIGRGRVLNVRVYPSQFGKERMAREEKEGPPAEVFKKRDDEEEEEVNEKNIYDVGEGEDYDEDALRRYQLERLRYYYAIVTCDTVEAASHIFDELEGTEFERSANVFDLSFVPDDMSFDDEPRDEANGSLMNYKGLEFVTDALRHSKVKLTWDEDDPERNQVTRRKLTREEIDNADFKAYIASSESESEEDNNKTKMAASRDKLRALLLSGDNDNLPEGWGDEDGDNGQDINMEVTFAPGLSSVKGPEDETTLERYQRKMREKRKKQKEEQKPKELEEGDDFFVGDSGSDQEDKTSKAGSLKTKGKQSKRRDEEDESRPVTSKAELALLATSDDPNVDAKHFDFKAVVKAEKNKGRKGKGKRKGVVDQDEIQEDFAIDVKDERFSAIHENHAFAIDPSHPQFKKTKSMAALLEERTARQHETKGRESGNRHDRNESKNGSNQKSLDSLVESVKRKSNNTQHGSREKRLRT